MYVFLVFLLFLERTFLSGKRRLHPRKTWKLEVNFHRVLCGKETPAEWAAIGPPASAPNSRQAWPEDAW